MTQRPSDPELTLPRFVAVNAFVSLGFGLAVGWSGGSVLRGVAAFGFAFMALQLVWLCLLVRTARADRRDEVRGHVTAFDARERRSRVVKPEPGPPLPRGHSGG